MPFVDTPNVVMCEIVGQKDGQVIENRVMVNVLHQPSAGDLSLLSNAFEDWAALLYAGQLPVEVVINTLRFTSMDARDRIQLATAVNIPGLVTGGAMPNEVTYCVSLRTSQIGRSARGRFYVLGVPKVNVPAENRVAAGFRAAARNNVDALRSAIAGLGFVPVIVSYRSNGVPRPGGPVYFVWTTTTTVDDVLDSQRRRRPGIGT